MSVVTKSRSTHGFGADSDFQAQALRGSLCPDCFSPSVVFISPHSRLAHSCFLKYYLWDDIVIFKFKTRISNDSLLKIVNEIFSHEG